MRRWLSAFGNSQRALRRLVASEAAFREEVIAIGLGLPVAWLITASLIGYLLLIGVLVMLAVVEALNTGIEKACDALTRDFHPDIRFAKDCGSLAVLGAMALAMAVWAAAAWHWWQGTPL